MSLEQVAQAVNGEMVGSNVDMLNISINTRSDCAGRLFVALKGDNFDAHDYVESASKAGAAALLIERKVKTDLPYVLVSDTRLALKELSRWWRSQFDIPVIGVTGSVGKTTVKEMLGSIFAQIGKGVVTHGNLNNEIGVPLTLMRLTKADKYAIVEMGMNNAGEIARLSNIARPTVAMVNNAAAAHLEGLGTVEAVAHAKGEIFSGLASDGIAVINFDDQFSGLWHDLAAGHKTIEFGLSSHAQVTATCIEKGNKIEVSANVLGESVNYLLSSIGIHSVRNSLAALSCAYAAGADISAIIAGLENYRPVKGRMSPITVAGVVVFDDTYNANPASMKAAIDVLANYSNSVLVVGDMAELGSIVEDAHKEIGHYAKERGISSLLACGRYAAQVTKGFGDRGFAFTSQDNLINHITKKPIDADAILVKGSRSAQMEKVVVVIQDVLRGSPHEINANKNIGNIKNGGGVS